MEEVKETEIVDNAKIAESVSEHIKFDTLRQFLVKPLDPVMVKKEFSKPVTTKAPTKDENGVEAADYEKVETEVKEVESDYRKGIVIKVPLEYQSRMNDEKFPAIPVKIGDIIIYKAMSGMWFDQIKDSQLVDSYNIIAIEK